MHEVRVLNNHLVFPVTYPDKAMAFFPGSKVVEAGGQHYCAAPHTLETTRILRNKGLAAPAPILTDYNWPGRFTPYPHQKDTAAFLTLYERCFCLNGMGTGKTAATLWAADYMMTRGGKRRCLIVSPLSTLERVWADEIFYNLPHRSFAVLHGTRAKRQMMLAEEQDFYIINHDGVATIADELRARDDIDLVIIDEVASYRNHRTMKFKFLDALLNKSGSPKAAWGLTGTPTPEAPTDAYGQAKLVIPEKVRGLYYNTFKSQVMYQINMYRWIPKQGSEQKVKELLSPSIRYALEDCIDLPETITQFRECALSPMQAKHYKELVNEAVTEINGTDISAVNAAVLVNKLAQAACGVVYGNNGDIVRLDFGPRLTLLEEVISECDQKVIVFVPFTGALRVLQEHLQKKWTVEVVDGSTPKGKRNQIFHDFQHTAEPHILLANAGTMAHGLALTAASTIVWYAPCNSNDIYNQANARIVRPGQKNVTNIINIFGTSLEMKTYKSSKEKNRLQDILLSLVKEETRT